MRPKRVVISGIIAGIVILIISMLFSTIFQTIFAYNVLELGGMRSATDPIMALFFLFPFVVSFAVAILYGKTKNSFHGTASEKGLLLGLLAWLVSSIPSAFIVFSSMDYPIGFTLNSVIGTLVYMVAAGIIIAKIQK